MAVVTSNGTRARWSGVAFAAAVAVGLASAAATQGIGSNSHLRVFTTRAIATVLAKVGADFERRTGRKLDITTDVAIRMVRRIDAGEPFDLLVAAPSQIDELIRAGKIIPETRTDLARSGIGVAVRAGAPKPDVSSVDAFTRALIAARSIAYLKEGQSGAYVARVLERLGVADTIRSKLTLPETDIVSELVSRGELSSASWSSHRSVRPTALHSQDRCHPKFSLTSRSQAASAPTPHRSMPRRSSWKFSRVLRRSMS
jgi:molybdate transport system substrate-binding protein